MRSAEVKDYVNTTDIVKVQNGQIYFRASTSSAEYEVIPENKYPGMNKHVYNLFKIMAYHTKKTDGYMVGFYQSRNEPKYVQLQFFVNKNDNSNLLYGAIDLTVYLEPTKSLSAEKYYPGKQKGDTYYLWMIGALKKHSDLVDAGWKQGMPVGDFDNTIERYEVLLEDLCQEVYGKTQGTAFKNFVISEKDKYYKLLEKYKSDFIGFKADMSFELVYIYPDVLPSHVFWTDKPEVMK
jgi:hypothetical protein